MTPPRIKARTGFLSHRCTQIHTDASAVAEPLHGSAASPYADAEASTARLRLPGGLRRTLPTQASLLRRALPVHKRTAASQVRVPEVVESSLAGGGCLGSSLSRRIAAESEPASQARLQGLIGRRRPLATRSPRHGEAVDSCGGLTIKPRPSIQHLLSVSICVHLWFRQSTPGCDRSIRKPRPRATVRAFGGFRGKEAPLLIKVSRWRRPR